MTLPEGVQPSGSVPDEVSVTSEETTSTTSTWVPTAEEPPASVAEDEETETPEEAASDAVLRQWAKDNGIDGVPASGRLSAAWREEITAAMAESQAQNPKEEGSANDTSFEPSTSEDEETESTTGGPKAAEPKAEVEPEPESETDADAEAQDEGDEVEAEEQAPVPPEREQMEYRSVFKAPNTWVSSQAFTN